MIFFRVSVVFVVWWVVFDLACMYWRRTRSRRDHSRYLDSILADRYNAKRKRVKVFRYFSRAENDRELRDRVSLTLSSVYAKPKPAFRYEDNKPIGISSELWLGTSVCDECRFEWIPYVRSEPCVRCASTKVRVSAIARERLQPSRYE